MHRIFGSKQKFGSTSFALINDLVDTMISWNTKEEWDCTYNDARLLLANNSNDMTLLHKIHGDSIYYTGYYVWTLFLNLSRLGCTPAEENHSGNIRHSEKCAHWCIVEEVNHILKNHKQSVLKFFDLELDWHFVNTHVNETIDENHDTKQDEKSIIMVNRMGMCKYFEK